MFNFFAALPFAALLFILAFQAGRIGVKFPDEDEMLKRIIALRVKRKVHEITVSQLNSEIDRKTADVIVNSNAFSA